MTPRRSAGSPPRPRQAVAATGGANGLDLRLGTAGDHRGLVAAIGANLAGTSFDLDVGLEGKPWVQGGVQALVDHEAEADAPALLDRLTRLRDVEWRLSALLVPLPREAVRGHAAALVRLALRIADDRTRQVQLTPETTSNREDPLMSLAAEAVERGQQRVTRALHCGAFALVAELSAPDGPQLAAAVGAVAGAAPSAATSWRFTGPRREDEPLPVTVLESPALVDLLRPPLHDVFGLPRRDWHRLHEHPEPALGSGPTLKLGRTQQGATLEIPRDQLLHHLLVTGATGSGKSSVVARILVDLAASGTPFWVIEPVKNEWHSLPVPGLARWAPGAADPGRPWSFNPLEVPEGVSVSTHLDLLVALFRSSLGLPDPLPHLIELGLQRTYEGTGWDLRADRRIDQRSTADDHDWPSVSDLLDTCLALPAELGYDPHIQGNLRAATLARLGGLVRGPRGRLLDASEPFPIDEALRRPLVVNLDAIGDDHARSFLMGLLLIRLAEHRRSNPSASLVHVTMVEEAHRLMGSGDRPAAAETADPTGTTATAFANLLGEVRATGEGIVVVDQSPTQLVRSVLINTGSQIALRSKDRADQEALGSAMGLEEGTERVLGGLGRHEAIVSWEGMDAPVRATLDGLRLVQAPAPRGEGTAVGVPAGAHRVARAAGIFVRAGAPDHARARSELLAAIDADLGALDPASKLDVLRDAVGREVRTLARARGWSPAERTLAVAEALAGRFGPGHPSRRLVDGRQPHLACAAACPRGGCLVGELVEPEARRLLDEGPGTVVRLVADPVEARHRIRRRAVAAVAPTAPTALSQLAPKCIAVKVFDEWGDPDLVAALVAEVEGGQIEARRAR